MFSLPDLFIIPPGVIINTELAELTFWIKDLLFIVNSIITISQVRGNRCPNWFLQKDRYKNQTIAYQYKHNYEIFTHSE